MENSTRFEASWNRTPVDAIASRRRAAAGALFIFPAIILVVSSKLLILVALVIQEPATFYVCELRRLILLP